LTYKVLKYKACHNGHTLLKLTAEGSVDELHATSNMPQFFIVDEDSHRILSILVE